MTAVFANPIIHTQFADLTQHALTQSDVQVACGRLGARSLEQCKRANAPAYISREHTACAVISCSQDASVSVQHNVEPAVIEVASSGGHAWQETRHWWMSSSDMYGYAQEHFMYDDCCGQDNTEFYGYGQSHEPPHSATWDWKTGRIVNGVQRESCSFEAKIRAVPAPAKQSKSAARRNAASRRGTSQMTLAASLSSLTESGTDCRCVIYARQVQKLGLRSAEILREYCEEFGPVEDVLLSNLHAKSEDTCAYYRVRPSGIALIVMQKWTDAARILAQGENIVVNGVNIRIRAFEERKEEGTQNIEADEKACVGVAEDADTDASDSLCRKISSGECSASTTFTDEAFSHGMENEEEGDDEWSMPPRMAIGG